MVPPRFCGNVHRAGPTDHLCPGTRVNLQRSRRRFRFRHLRPGTLRLTWGELIRVCGGRRAGRRRWRAAVGRVGSVRCWRRNGRRPGRRGSAMTVFMTNLHNPVACTAGQQHHPRCPEWTLLPVLPGTHLDPPGRIRCGEDLRSSWPGPKAREHRLQTRDARRTASCSPPARCLSLPLAVAL